MKCSSAIKKVQKIINDVLDNLDKLEDLATDIDDDFLTLVYDKKDAIEELNFGELITWLEENYSDKVDNDYE